MAKKIYVPIGERELNKVDILIIQIKRIQENCDHDFRLVKEPKLVETLVPNVFVGLVEKGPTRVGFADTRMTLVCMKCSEEKEASITTVCPKCLGKMKGETYSLGAGSREKYFGEKYLYFAVRLFSCTNCHLTVASDEWDQ